MLRLKSASDIENLAAGGAILARVLEAVAKEAVAGAVPQELDKRARVLLAEHDCVPSFLNYAPRGHKPFPAALCVSVNDGVVHGLPSTTPLKDGDVVGLDLGLVYKDKYFLDHAHTVIVGKGTEEAVRLLAVTREALQRGIAAAQAGNQIGDVSAAIQTYVEGEGFALVRELVGHGVGFAVHEEPQVPNWGKAHTGHKLEPGLVIAIEPMVVAGDPAITTGSDGWTIVTKSGALAAHEEHTVAITDHGPQVLTK
jgi:methionyl aminopeptidase